MIVFAAHTHTHTHSAVKTGVNYAVKNHLDILHSYKTHHVIKTIKNR